MFNYKLLVTALSVILAFADKFSPVNTAPAATEKQVAYLHKPAADSSHTLSETAPAPPAFTVSASVYFPEPNQTDDTPYTTADGSRINKHNPKKQRWIAVSRDLHSRWGGEISYGDSLWVSGISSELDGIYIVRDVMNRRIRNRIDILVGRHDRIMGFWDDVQVARIE